MLSVHMVSILCAFSAGCSADTGDIPLSVNGKPRAAIVVSADAIPAEHTAAKELANHLKQVTGADFPIVSSAPQASARVRIYVGQTVASKRRVRRLDSGTLGKDGIIIRKIGNDLILAGDRPRGTLYAVYTFLEDNVGCRWWTPNASYIPEKPTLSVRVNDVTYTPPFMCRETFYKNVMSQNPEFAAKLKLNGHFQPIPPELGGHYSILGFCHTFYQLIPPDKYFKDHAEWFSEIEGKRMHEHAQLCLTNEAMRKELVINALGWIKSNPDAGIISITQNDWTRPCQCAKCRAIVEKTGAESGPVIAFVNSVAEEIEKYYPGFLVETLAYQYTRKAPANIKVRRNVIVRLCSIECDFAKPLDGPTNTAFHNDLKAWQAISSQLYVWDYTVDFTNLMMPHPNFRVLAPNIRLFEKSNVVGLFEQGDGYNPDANFAAMKTWLLAHLMWDPKLSESELMDEFLSGYYGAAGKYMREYIDLICDSVEKTGPRLCWQNKNYVFLTPEVINKAGTLFDSAEESVQANEELVRRIRLQRAAVYLAMVVTSSDEDIQPIKGLDKVCDKFLAISDPSNNNFRQEGIVMSPAYRQNLKDTSQGKQPSGYDGRKASDLSNYSDEKAFAEMRKTMTEVFDFPKDGWKFKRDKANIGHEKGWFKTDFDDSAWRAFSIGKFMEEQIGDYDGIAWYRLNFTAPAIQPGKQIFLVFGAVDDSAKMWLNGQTIGEHEGWDSAFALDVTQILKQGQENSVAVKVMDNAGFGGIWKSVKLMVK